MRYSKEHKQETHAQIVRKASMRLREKGAHGVGVADLMKEAGLTHGGFYAHFDSREALLIEAFVYAMDRSMENWRKRLVDLPPDKRLTALVESYLSAAHRDEPGRGCAVTSLGPEIARESVKTRRAFAAKVEEMMGLLSEQYLGCSPKLARRKAEAALATMVGAIVLARIAGAGGFSDEILEAGRDAVLGKLPAAPPSPARARPAPSE